MKFYTTSKISENIHETPEGFLVCIGVPIARTGEMVYGEGETPLEVGEDGRILIQREAEEVFRPETIASFEGKAVTITHPTEFVDPDNWSRLAKGMLQNVRRGEGEQENDLIADLLITDSVAINLVKNGLREVSCGYEAEYTQTGEGRGLQTKIVGNHLALVDEGRAGSAYAINDHKGKGSAMKLKDKIKAIFAKAQDEAMAMADAEEKKPEEKKPAKDADGDKDEKESKDAGAYDELKKMVSDLGEKIAAMGGKQKDASSQPSENEPAKVDAKDDDVATSLEDRLKALEASVAKLLEHQAPASDEESEDADESEEGEESEDDDFEESTMTGDTASRIEILAPGLKAKGADGKSKALIVAYATKDGKAVIDQLTGGKAPELKDPKRVNTLFIAASELLKVSRTSELARTKQTRDFSSASETPKGAMSAEQLNAINAKHYGGNKS